MKEVRLATPPSLGWTSYSEPRTHLLCPRKTQRPWWGWSLGICRGFPLRPVHAMAHQLLLNTCYECLEIDLSTQAGRRGGLSLEGRVAESKITFPKTPTQEQVKQWGHPRACNQIPSLMPPWGWTDRGSPESSQALAPGKLAFDLFYALPPTPASSSAGLLITCHP